MRAFVVVTTVVVVLGWAGDVWMVAQPSEWTRDERQAKQLGVWRLAICIPWGIWGLSVLGWV